MKSDVLWALKASHSEKNFEPYLRAQFKQFSREKNCTDFAFLSATFPLLGSTILKFHLRFVGIPFFLSSHILSYLLILLKYKNLVFFVFFFFMSFQLTSLRYYQVAQAKKQAHFY
jgi:hypothetical protein